MCKLHIRLQRDVNSQLTDKMILALDVKNNKFNYPRFIQARRVFTTLEHLQYIALSTAPNAHSIIIDDCATYARDYLEEVATRLTDNQRQQEAEAHMEEVKKLITIVTESAQSEAISSHIAQNR